MKLDVNVNLKNINWRRLVYTRRFFLWGLLLVSSALLILIFAIIPLIQDTIELNESVRQETESLKRLNTKLEALSKVDIMDAYRQSDRVNSALPSEKPLLQLLASVNGGARETGVAISNIETSPGRLATGSAQTDTAAPTAPRPGTTTRAARPSSYQPLTIEVTIRGTLAQINQFLDRIERSAPLTDVTQIELESVNSRQVQVQGQFQAQLNLTTYYFTQPISVVIDAPLPEIGTKELSFLQNLETFTFPQIQKQENITGGGLEDLFGTNSQGEVQRAIQEASQEQQAAQQEAVPPAQ